MDTRIIVRGFLKKMAGTSYNENYWTWRLNTAFDTGSSDKIREVFEAMEQDRANHNQSVMFGEQYFIKILTERGADSDIMLVTNSNLS